MKMTNPKLFKYPYIYKNDKNKIKVELCNGYLRNVELSLSEQRISNMNQKIVRN